MMNRLLLQVLYSDTILLSMQVAGEFQPREQRTAAQVSSEPAGGGQQSSGAGRCPVLYWGEIFSKILY